MASERSGRTLAEASRIASDDPSVRVRSGIAPTAEAVSRSEPAANHIRAMSLHVSKLRGISVEIRNRLKRQGISYTHQLLREAGSAEQRGRLAARGRIDEVALARLVRRADLARIKGIVTNPPSLRDVLGLGDGKGS